MEAKDNYININVTALGGLCQAVVVTAAKDYFSLRSIVESIEEKDLISYVTAKKLERCVEEIENIKEFFVNGWFELAYNINGEEFFQKLSDAYESGDYEEMFVGYMIGEA